MKNTTSASNIGPSSGISAGDARKLANAPWPSTILNIGHFIGGRPALSRLAVEIALYPLRSHIVSHTVQQSSSEPTSVIVLDCYLSDEHLSVLCDQLQQDAITCYDTAEGTGRVVGPRAADWSPFNPDFFIFPEA